MSPERRQQIREHGAFLLQAKCSIDGSLYQRDTQDLLNALEAAEAEAARLREDKDRLDWWEAHLNYEHGIEDDDMGGLYVKLYRVSGPINDREWTEVARKKTLRACIDAGRAREQSQPAPAQAAPNIRAFIGEDSQLDYCVFLEEIDADGNHKRYLVEKEIRDYLERFGLEVD